MFAPRLSAHFLSQGASLWSYMADAFRQLFTTLQQASVETGRVGPCPSGGERRHVRRLLALI